MAVENNSNREKNKENSPRINFAIKSLLASLAFRGNSDADVLVLDSEDVEPTKPFKPLSIEEQREDAKRRSEWMRIAFATDRFNVIEDDSPSVAEKFVPDDIDVESLLDLTAGSES